MSFYLLSSHAARTLRHLTKVHSTLLSILNTGTIGYTGKPAAAAMMLSLLLNICYCLLQLLHETVVDTSVVFPHKMGAPFKRALKFLAADHLKRIIQNDGESNSFPDSNSTLGQANALPIGTNYFRPSVENQKIGFSGRF